MNSASYTVRAILADRPVEFFLESARDALEHAVDLISAGAVRVHVVDPAGRHFYQSQFENLYARAA